jgi:hypothetical protein
VAPLFPCGRGVGGEGSARQRRAMQRGANPIIRRFAGEGRVAAPNGSIGAELCSFRRERRVYVSSDRPCNVDRRTSDFNILGANLCNFATPKADLTPPQRRVSSTRSERRNASSQVPPSRTKAGPRKTKENQGKRAWILLDFLGFLRPIRGFSRGYEQSKSKKATSGVSGGEGSAAWVRPRGGGARSARRAFAAAPASARRESEEGSSVMHALRRRTVGSLKGHWHKVRLFSRKSS